MIFLIRISVDGESPKKKKKKRADVCLKGSIFEFGLVDSDYTTGVGFH